MTTPPPTQQGWTTALLLLGALVVPMSRAAAQSRAPHETNGRSEQTHLERARDITAHGMVRFEQGDYDAAVAAFLEAYELLRGDSRQAALLNNVAVSYERMFRYDLALVYYERYLTESEPDEADLEEVRRIVAGLRGLLGRVRIRTNVPASVWIGKELTLKAPGEVWVPAGTHVVEARAHGYESERREVRVAPRSTQTLDVVLSRVPQYHGVHRRYFWTGIGLTGAALVTGTAFGVKALTEHRNAQSRLSDGLVTQDDNQSIDRLQLSADISFGVAALFGVGTLVLFFVTDLHREQKGRPDSVSLAARALAGGGTLQLTGKFR